MANNQYINKVIYGGNTLIDLSSDTATTADVASGVTFHDKTGAPKTGTSTKDSDTSDATIAVAEMLSGKTGYARGAKLTGTMPNNGSVTGIISTKDQTYTIPQGYHDGSGTVSISTTEQAKIIADNIRQGVTILGVDGAMSGSEDVKAQTATATPYTTSQTILPDSDHNYLTQVTVAAIAYTETDNSAGGKTATIGTVAP